MRRRLNLTLVKILLFLMNNIRLFERMRMSGDIFTYIYKYIYAYAVRCLYECV